MINLKQIVALTISYGKPPEGLKDLLYKLSPFIRKADGSWLRNIKRKVDAFVDHLENIFKQYEIITDIDIQEVTFLVEDIAIEIVTPKEVKNEMETNPFRIKHPVSTITGEVPK